MNRAQLLALPNQPHYVAPAMAQQPPAMAQIQAQLDRTVLQVTSTVTGLANQIATDQARIAALEKDLADARKATSVTRPAE
jgi:hypothetical protein